MKPDTALIVVALLLFPASAWAYVDPGSGMLLWQGLIAAVGALIVFVRNPIQTIRSWLDRIRRKDR